jgi:hypothetical protein
VVAVLEVEQGWEPGSGTGQMNRAAKYLLLLLVSAVLCPAVIVFHEVRHYAVGSCLGLKCTMNYCATSYLPSDLPSQRPAMLLMAWAGPLGDAALAGAGLLWLYRLRRHRRQAVPTWVDWLATLLALQAFRWLRGYLGSPWSPQPGDEAYMSRTLGLPGWLLPYLLALLCWIPLSVMVRLHPPGARLLPFTCLVVGGIAGALVWLKLLGPVLLP